MSIDDAASVTGLSSVALSAWEHGFEKPTLGQLEVLADIYDCPVGYFFLSEVPPSESKRLDFRGVAPEKADSLSYESTLKLRRFLRLLDYTGKLITQGGIDWLITIDSAKLTDSIEELASAQTRSLGVTAEVRARWRTRGEAFSAWRSAIEKKGILVIALKLDPGEVRGASSWNFAFPPGILVNHEDSEAAAGRTFTLLHEYAHLLIGQPGVVCDFQGVSRDGRVERFANRFAAECLVPRADFVRLLQEKGQYEFRAWWGDSALNELREPFAASRDTVAILLEELSLAPSDFYRQKRRAWDRKKPGGFSATTNRVSYTNVQRRIRDFGRGLCGVLASAYQKGLVSSLELAEILDLKVEKTDDFLALARLGQR